MSEKSIFHSKKPGIEPVSGIEPKHLASLFALRSDKILKTFHSAVPKAYQKPVGPPPPELQKEKASAPKTIGATPAVKPVQKRIPGPKHQLSKIQQVSVEFFTSLGVCLLEDFNRDELKHAYRLLALKLHPDRSKGSASQFIELKAHYETLKRLFK